MWKKLPIEIDPSAADKLSVVAARQVLQSFLTDALRMSAQATECVNILVDQVRKKRVSPAQVRSLYQLIHTLKGTASMVDGGAPIVKALHEIESRLTTQSILESSRRPDWLDLAGRSIEQANRALLDMQRKERRREVDQKASDSTVRGFLVRPIARTEGDEVFPLWFPLSVLTRVLSPDEVSHGDVICLQGAWVPVLGRKKSSSANGNCLGLGVKSKQGQAVILISEVLGVVTWNEAAKQGAQTGLDILLSHKAA
jgi:hypothetical protein